MGSRRLFSVLIWLLATSASVLRAQVPDTAAAIRGLQDFDDACRRDGGALWGVTLCGPVLLVHAPTRLAVANAPDPNGEFVEHDGAWVGTLPADMMVANTGIDWGGRRWAMALLPVPDSAAGVALVAHESFHRIQPELGLPFRDPPNAHLAEGEGRVWLRLEARALAAAVRAEGADARQHARAALLFRAARHAAFPGADTLEAALELHEGLAEYTGARVAYTEHELPQRVADMTEAGERRTSYVRALGYITGPALGVLLDRYAPGWRGRAAEIASLAGELKVALDIADGELDVSAAPAVAERYGYAVVTAAEDARAAEHEVRLAAYRRAFIEGPVLELRAANLSASFNPNQVVPLPGAGTVYPTGVFSAEWGRLEVTDGALVAPDFSMITVAAPTDARSGGTIEGPGWTLQLAAGWSVTAAERPGNFVVTGPAKD